MSKRAPIVRLRTVLFLLVGVVVLGLVACAVRSTTPAPTLAPTKPAPPTAPPATAVPTPGPATPAPAPAYQGKPLANFSTDDFSGSARCAMCHSPLKDSAGVDVSIDAAWRSTMMANAARDPLFLASVGREIEQTPALRATIEEKCSGCHMPMAFTQTKVQGGTPGMFEAGLLNPQNALNPAAMDGVSCSLCHQIAERNLGKRESFSGGYVVDTSTSPPDRLVYGPFPAPEQQMMRKSTGFTPVEGKQMGDAALCGACHTLFTPYVDATGTVLGEFPEQTPFLEWQHSAYSAQARPCQSCHMPAAANPVLISTLKTTPPLVERSPFVLHHFVGANALMLNVHRDNAAELQLTCSMANLDASLERVLNQVQGRAAALSIASTQANSSNLEVVLELKNLAGHKLPTGFPSRRMWLHVTVTDAASKLVFESGQPQPDGTIAGDDEDADEKAFEPHYDVITQPGQVQVYQSVMANSDGQVTRRLLRGSSYVKDNRLLPQGFDKTTAGADFAVRGEAAQDANFQGGADRVTYRIDVGSAQGPFTITAELLYETLAYRFAQDVTSGSADSAKLFSGYYASADKAPLVMASVQQTGK